MKKVLIIGSEGQDGRLLRERAQRDGHQSIGISRGDCDLLDRSKVTALINRWRPDELYYLPAYHHSSEDRLDANDAAFFAKSFGVHVTGLIHCLEAIKTQSPQTRLFYAASSHIFGQPITTIQDENTPLNPTCVYGITKAAGVQCCRFYRTTRQIFAAVGILYNHESAYRRPNFVSQKIIRGALAIQRGEIDQLVLGDLAARIDWGYAPDYVDAMTRILAEPEPDDFVIATGQTHSVQEFVETTFHRLGLDWRKHVIENPALLTKRKVALSGNAAKLQQRTEWYPTVTFEELADLLLREAQNGAH